MERLNSASKLAAKELKTIMETMDITPKVLLLRDIRKEDVEWCEVCIAIRPNTPESVNLARFLVSKNAYYCILFDDDLVNRKKSLQWRSSSSKECIKLCNAIISTSMLLLNDYKTLNSKGCKAILINSMISKEDIKDVCEDNSKPRIVYAAGKDHAPLFNQFVLPAFQRIVADRENIDFELVFVGVHPSFEGTEIEKYCSFVPLMPLEDYNQYMQDSRFDIGIAPLDDSDFSARKYFNKFLEYSKLGIAGVYSNLLPYTLIVENGINGILVDNTIDGWSKGIMELLNDHALRKRIVQNAQKQIRETFTIQSARTKLFSELPELLVYNKCNKGKSYKKHRFINVLFCAIDYGYKFKVRYLHF